MYYSLFSTSDVVVYTIIVIIVIMIIYRAKTHTRTRTMASRIIFTLINFTMTEYRV